MEGAELASLKAKIYTRKLNINAPILSTKRLGLSNGAAMLSNNDMDTTQNTVSERIPFSWEQAAGKPKDMEQNNGNEDTPRLRLPPALWHKEMIQHGDNESDDVFTDATDVFSLSEALDIVQKSDEAEELDGLKSKLAESRGDHSPSYIIKRFLPDATAAASASSCSQVTENFEKPIRQTRIYLESCESSGLYQSDPTSPKGCGLELLSPWRIKHKLCGAGSPVQPCSPSLYKHHSSATSRKKKHYDSSACRNFNNVRRDT